MDKAMERAIRRGVSLKAIKQAIKEAIEETLFGFKVYDDDIQIFSSGIMQRSKEKIEALEPTGQPSPGCEWLADLIIGELEETEKEMPPQSGTNSVQSDRNASDRGKSRKVNEVAMPAIHISKPVSRVLEAYSTENLRNALMGYPQRIYAARQELNRARQAFKNAEMERAMAEAELLLAISVETDEKGKAKFTNAEARAAELIRRKAADPAYIAAAGAATDAEAACNEAQDALQMLLDEYQSARIVARLIASELDVISGLTDVEDMSFAASGNGYQKPITREAF